MSKKPEKILVFDCETTSNLDLVENALEAIEDPEDKAKFTPGDMALSPLWGKVVAIGVYEEGQDKPIIWSGPDEQLILAQFWEAVRGTDYFISFNGMRFDVPFIEMRSALLGVKPTIKIIQKRWQWYNHFDLYMFFTDWNQNAKPCKHINMRLRTVCRALGIQPPFGDGKEVPMWVAQNDWERIDFHLSTDLIATMEVWKRFKHLLHYA